MGIKLKGWQKGALLSIGFYLFWFGIFVKIFPEGQAIDPVAVFTIILVTYIFGPVCAILGLPIGPHSIHMYGVIGWGIMGSGIGYLIGYALRILKPKRGYNNEK